MRRSKRIKCHVPASCYSEAGRFEARTVNVSTSGAFLRTRQQPAVGGQLAVVVAPHVAGPRPTQLLAKVVRTQLGNLPGIGVQWTRAITPQGADALVSFLSTFLHTAPEGLSPHVSRQGELTVFDFAAWGGGVA